MNKILAASVIAAMLTSPAAHAAQAFYVAGTLGLGQGNAWISNGVERFDSTNASRPVSILAGYAIKRHLALEAGHAIFGMYDFVNGAELDTSATFLAMAGTMELGRNWSLTGKIGAARHQVEFTVPGMVNEDHSKTLRMLAIGTQYQFTDKLAATLQLVDYGSSRTGPFMIEMRQFELGIRYNF